MVEVLRFAGATQRYNPPADKKSRRAAFSARQPGKKADEMLFFVAISRMERCSFAKNGLILNCRETCVSGRHIFTKVFSLLSLCENVEVFFAAGRTDNTHSLYSYVVCSLQHLASYYSGVGYCVVYCCTGLSTTFTRINGISSTLSFFNPVSRGAGGCNVFYYGKTDQNMPVLR